MSYFGIYPSIELQALDFAKTAKARPEDYHEANTDWNGFAVQMGYLPSFVIGEHVIGRVLCITNLSVPKQYRSSKWLLHYLDFCILLAEGALVVMAVHDWMEDALSNTDVFKGLGNGIWIVVKRG